ncbi:MAG: ribosome maturation factor RimM [Candidatus Zixiibacteriota bacterium]
MSLGGMIAIGRFGRTRGLDGDIYVIPYSGDTSRIQGLRRAYLEIEGEAAEVQIERNKLYSGRLAIKLAGYDTPETACTLTKRDLYVKEDQLERLPEGEYYAYQLEGSQVESVGGEKLGTLKEVESFPANDVYVIKMDGERTFRIPAVKRFVKSVDIKNKTVVIDPPDGWQDAV